MSRRITERVTIGTNHISRSFDVPDAVGVVTSADADGTVLTSLGDGTYDFEAGGSGGGGSVDLGVVRSTDLLANGSTMIYTSSGTDYVVIAPGPADFQAADHQNIVVASANAALGVFLEPATTSTDQIAPLRGRIYTTGPLYAILQTEANGWVVETPPLAWAATHAYAATSIIRGPDSHLWSSGSDGTSGGSIPDFAGNEGGTVVDGSVTWTDEGHVPTTGAIHLYAIVTPI